MIFLIDSVLSSIAIDDEDEEMDSMEEKATIISCPVYRCSKSHR